MLGELIKSLRDLGALEKRTEDVLKAVEKLAQKVDILNERVIKIEAEQRHLQESVKNSILADIKADIVQTKALIDLQRIKFDGMLPNGTPPAS